MPQQKVLQETYMLSAIVAAALLSACGAGTTKPEDITAFYTRYDYLIGQDIRELATKFKAPLQPVAIPADNRNAPAHAAAFDLDATIEYTGFELSPERETVLRANQAVAAGQWAPPGLEIMADFSELERVTKEDACGLRIYIDEDGRVLEVVMLGDVYTVRVIKPVPTSCTKRLDEYVGYSEAE